MHNVHKVVRKASGHSRTIQEKLIIYVPSNACLFINFPLSSVITQKINFTANAILSVFNPFIFNLFNDLCNVKEML